MGPEEQLALRRTQAAALDPTRPALLKQTMEGHFLPGSAGANPHLDAAIKAAQRPTLQGLEETIGRTMRGKFTLAGQSGGHRGSSAFDRAGGIATRGAADAMGDIATKMSHAGYESERGKQMLAIQLGQNDVDTLATNLKSQGLPRMIQEMGIERGIGLHDKRLASLMQALQLAAGITSPHLGTFGANRSEGESESGIVPGLAALGQSLGGGGGRRTA